jgi:hypothetical protein
MGHMRVMQPDVAVGLAWGAYHGADDVGDGGGSDRDGDGRGKVLEAKGKRG